MSVNLYDVVVLGAGAAGLTAARALARAGRRVAVVEARERIGGRIHTVPIDVGDGEAIPVELGAEFIHGLPPATWELVRRGGLTPVELSGTAFSLRGGRMTADGAQSATGSVLEDVARWTEQHPAGSDMTFADYLVRHLREPAAVAAATHYVEGFNAADRHRIGIAGLGLQQRAEQAIDGDRLFRLTRGYRDIPRLLGEELAQAGGELLLGRPVRRIAWTRGAVRLHGTERAGRAFELAARQAIVTAPLGVLQAEAIEFEPRPEAILREAKRLAMGAALRVVLVFRSRFWCDATRRAQHPDLGSQLDDLGFLFTPEDIPATWWTPHPEPLAMLTAWAGGPKAAAWQKSIAADARPDAPLAACLAVLSRAFGMPVPELERLLAGWRMHDWLHDAYSRGAYSYVPAGAVDAPRRMAAPVDGTLFFAGEHTDLDGHWGTVHAALDSGARAAAAAIAASAGG